LGHDGPVTPLKIELDTYSLDPQNLEMIVSLHDNMRKMKMTYVSNILPNLAAGQPVAQVVNDD